MAVMFDGGLDSLFKVAGIVHRIKYSKYINSISFCFFNKSIYNIIAIVKLT
jgi:hypothetical protein